MKKLNIVVVFVSLFLMISSFSSAQVNVSFNVNKQPLWGPVSYDYVEYYYLPEYGIYYNAPKAQFVHLKGNKWVYTNSLPYQYRNANLFSTYKVVINEPNPYLRNEYYVNNYKHFKNERSKQVVIRDSHDAKYTNRKDHPNNAKNGSKSTPSANTYSKNKKSDNNNSSKKKDSKQHQR